MAKLTKENITDYAVKQVEVLTTLAHYFGRHLDIDIIVSIDSHIQSNLTGFDSNVEEIAANISVKYQVPISEAEAYCRAAFIYGAYIRDAKGHANFLKKFLNKLTDKKEVKENLSLLDTLNNVMIIEPQTKKESEEENNGKRTRLPANIQRLPIPNCCNRLKVRRR